MAQCDYTGDDPNHPGGSYALALAGFEAFGTATVRLRNDGLAYNATLVTTGLDDLGIGSFGGSLPGNLAAGTGYYFRAIDDSSTEADSSPFAIVVSAPPHRPQSRMSLGLGIGL